MQIDYDSNTKDSDKEEVRKEKKGDILNSINDDDSISKAALISYLLS